MGVGLGERGLVSADQLGPSEEPEVLRPHAEDGRKGGTRCLAAARTVAKLKQMIALRCRPDGSVHVKRRNRMHRVFQSSIDGLAASGNAETLCTVLAEASAALDLRSFAYLSLPSRKGGSPDLACRLQGRSHRRTQR